MKWLTFLPSRTQGIGQVILALHTVAGCGAAKIGGNAVVGVFEGQALHPAGEG